jgi:hypothetical protein
MKRTNVALALGTAIALALAGTTLGAPPAVAQSPIVRLPLELFAGRVTFITLKSSSGRPLHMILDTGSEDEILNARVAGELKLHISNPKSVDEPGGAVMMGAIDSLPVSLGGQVVRGLQFSSAPLDWLQPFLGTSIDGILGYNFLSRYVIELDYDRHQIAFYDPATYRAPRNAERIPITFRGHMPLVTVQLARTDGSLVTTFLELDTGSFEALGLDDAWVKRANLATGREPTRPIFGLAIGGETQGHRFRIPAMHIGRFTIARPVTSATTSDNSGSGASDIAGVFGAELLNRFRVVLDFGRSAVLLTPGARFGKPSDYFDKVGAQVVAEGRAFDTLRLRAIMPETPASEAKLRVGDVIVSVDGIRGSALTLERFALVTERTGRHVFRVQRMGRTLTIPIATRRLI